MLKEDKSQNKVRIVPRMPVTAMIDRVTSPCHKFTPVTRGERHGEDLVTLVTRGRNGFSGQTSTISLPWPPFKLWSRPFLVFLYNRDVPKPTLHSHDLFELC